MEQLALFDSARLPKKPYCSNNLSHGLIIRPLRTALLMRYIQPNRPGMTSYLAFDIDRPDAGVAWIDSNAPRPSFVIKNPDNGHCHYLYALATPVCTTSAARIQPLRYLSAIERSISRELGADPGYSGLIIKNPLHQHWQTIALETELYSLSSLASRLDLATAIAANAEVSSEALGLGRNVTIFDALRLWAYKAVTGYWRPGGEKLWLSAVRDRAHSLNLFPAPMQHKEVDQIAKSVGKWVWKHFSPTARRDLIERTHTPELQSQRGQLKGAKLRDAMLPRVQEMLAAGSSQSDVARALGISRQTISNWAKREACQKAYIR